MSGFFFDSSALVKLYHAEVGTPRADQIVNTPGNTIRISRLTPAELVSAFAIKVRTQAISRQDADVFLRQFRTDIVARKLEVFSVAEAEFAMAELLLERYAFHLRLRAFDALQLAVATELRDRGFVEHFVAADKILCEVGRLGKTETACLWTTTFGRIQINGNCYSLSGELDWTRSNGSSMTRREGVKSWACVSS